MPENITQCSQHSELTMMVREVRDCLIGNPSDPKDTGVRGMMQDVRDRLDQHDMFFVWIGRGLTAVTGIAFTTAVGVAIATMTNGCDDSPKDTYYGRPSAAAVTADTTRAIQ